MKPAYAICALLSVTIGTALVLAENGTETKPAGTTQPSKSIVPPNLAAGSSKTITDATTAEPSNNTLTTQEPIPTSSATPTKPPTPPPTTPSTTAVPSTKTTTSNTTIPATTSTTTPTPPKTTSHTPTTLPSSTAVPGTTDASKTTAIPPAHKDRQFDGLSFFGGIVLTTCLMAIAAFSWKFYRQCKEGNYRTL
ncbi:uncharacterized protein [Temnothorax nylanderi]|uniref:uncharacterized protein n=1 Tax=Temnothorax nylanderi TaxID=102681 RepID=UPI003A8B1B91